MQLVNGHSPRGRAPPPRRRAHSRTARARLSSERCTSAALAAMAPVKRGSHRAEVGVRPPCTGRSLDALSPSASPVLVFTPRRSHGRVGFVGIQTAIWLNLVAAPKHSGNTPVAKGSSVPVWPAFSACSSHLAFCSALLLDRPRGLSSKSTPCTGRRGNRGASTAARSAALRSSLAPAREDTASRNQRVHARRRVSVVRS